MAQGRDELALKGRPCAQHDQVCAVIGNGLPEGHRLEDRAVDQPPAPAWKALHHLSSSLQGFVHVRAGVDNQLRTAGGSVLNLTFHT